MTTPRRDRTLRNALLANAGFSTLTGAAMIAAASPLAAAFGVAEPLALTLVGANLLPFAAALVWLARRPTVPVRLAAVASVLDFGWVAGTGLMALLAPTVMNGTGWLAAWAVAAVVASLGAAQLAGIRRTGLPPDPVRDGAG